MFFVFFILGALSCSDSRNLFLEKNKPVKVDESKLVLTQFPSKIVFVNENNIATLNSFQIIGIYDLAFGNNILNFDISKLSINQDSLINSTFGKKYESSILYKTIEDDNVEPFGKKRQIKSFSFDNNKFYIHFSVLCDIIYKQDSSNADLINKNAKLKSLVEKYGSIQLTEMDFLDFLCITNDKFIIQKIIPIYYSNMLKNNGFVPLYNKQFFVENNKLYFAISKSILDKNSNKYIFHENIAQGDITNYDYLNIDEKELNLDYSEFNKQKFYSSPLLFSKFEENYYYSNTKEISRWNGLDKILAKNDLEKNEWIDAFSMINENKVIMFNSFHSSKLHPTEFELNYGVDSVTNKQIKIFDCKTRKSLLSEAIPLDSYSPISSNSKIVFMNKDDKNYFFNVINYGEN
jgi:hypothetical protein